MFSGVFGQSASNFRYQAARLGKSRLQHHVVCKYGCVYVSGLLFIKRAHPCLSIVSADDDRQRRSVKVRPFPNLRKSLTALHNGQTDRLEISRCRCNAGGLQILPKRVIIKSWSCSAWSPRQRQRCRHSSYTSWRNAGCHVQLGNKLFR